MPTPAGQHALWSFSPAEKHLSGWRGPEEISRRKHFSQRGPGIFKTLKEPGLISYNQFIGNRVKQRRTNLLAVDSLAFQKLLQAALTKLQENHHQYSPSPFCRSKHTGRFPGRADREILGPALFPQAWVKGSSGTNESSKKKNRRWKEGQMPRKTNRLLGKTTERDQGAALAPLGLGAPGRWHSEAAGREDVQGTHLGAGSWEACGW